jgi:glycosyltransferase involved in cell wall biosynthesis
LSAASQGGFPVVLRAVGLGRSGDCQWHKSVHFGGRIASRCRAADAVIAPNTVAVEELRHAGLDPRKIEQIDDGVPPRRRKDAALQQRARAELADVHPVLVVPQDAPFVLYSGPIRENPALLDLVAAWPIVLQRRPSARLWLAGDATGADSLWNEIQQADLTDSIILPGSFDHFDDLLPAVNVYVHAAHQSAPSLTMLQAMAAGVPIVANRTPLTESLLDDEADALLTPPGDHAALAEAIMHVLADGPVADRLAEAAWRKSSQRHTIGQMAQKHLSLFGRLVSSRILAMS